MDQNQLRSFIIAGVENTETNVGDPYSATFSTGNSGLSFGKMQNDVGSGNPIAKNYFTQIMNAYVGTPVGTGVLTQSDANAIVQAALKNTLTQQQADTASQAIAANPNLVNQADAAQANVVMGYVNGALQAAATNPNGPGELNSVAPDPQFLIDLAAWGNRA